MYEVNLHVTLLGQNVTIFLWRKVRGCSSVGMLGLEKSPLHKGFGQLLTNETDAFKMKMKNSKRNGLRGKSSALVSAGIVRKPFQVRALSGADHLASVSNGLIQDVERLVVQVNTSLPVWTDTTVLLSCLCAPRYIRQHKNGTYQLEVLDFSICGQQIVRTVLLLIDYYLDYS